MRKLSCQPRLARVLPLAVLVIAAVIATPAAARPLAHNGQITFARYDPVQDINALYTVNPDGTHEQQLLPLFGGGPRWSPDGTQIASPVTESGPGVMITNADSGASVEFPNADPTVDPFCNAWSPDGERLACETYGKDDPSLNGVYTIRSSDGGGLTRITSAGGGGDQPGDYSPDGKRIVYAHFAPCCDLPFDEWLAQSGMFLVNVNGTGTRKIAQCCTSTGSWSPRGNEIVFSRQVNPNDHSSLWVVHSDGSGLREVDVQVPAGAYPCGAPATDGYNPFNDPAVGGCHDPQWSPDGRKIVFGRGDDALGNNVYTVNADGSGLTQVTHGGADQSNETPDWGIHPLAH